MEYFIYPYTQGSKGAKDLATELQGKRILREGSNYKFKSGHMLINWGASDCPYSQALNADIKAVLNKREFFTRLYGSGLTPRFATSMADAKNLTYPVFCRTKMEGRDGAGIVIADNETQLVHCKLFVEGIDKTSEYRVHVGRLPNGEVVIIGAQKKVKKQQTPEMDNVPSDARIWCGDTVGFVWKVNGQPAYIPPAVIQTVTSAFGYFPELTFGGFDVIFDNSAGKAYVIEINSAPMSTAETMKLYGEFFRKFEQVLLQPASLTPPVLQPMASSVAPAAPAPTLSVDDILNRIFLGELSPTKVIEGYIQHVTK